MSSRRLCPREIRLWGTVARVVFGAALLGWAWADGLGLHTVVVAGGLGAAVAGFQLLRLRVTDTDLQVTDPVAHCINIVAFVVLASVDVNRSGLFVFYGLSALVAAARGSAGCEVTAISNWLLGRNDQVGCVLFTPIDVAERRLPARSAH